MDAYLTAEVRHAGGAARARGAVSARRVRMNVILGNMVVCFRCSDRRTLLVGSPGCHVMKVSRVALHKSKRREEVEATSAQGRGGG